MKPTKQLFCLLTTSMLSSGLQAQETPNVVFIIADDMGYQDIGCFGGNAHTPNLDTLAAHNMRLTNCYAAAPNCSPSRAGLLTGRIPARTGIYTYRASGHTMHLPHQEITIAEILQSAAYQTAHFGKWHLSCLPQDPNLNQAQPIDQGFDYSLGTENNAWPSHFYPKNFVRNGKALGELPGYSCQIVADEFCHWFKTQFDAHKPFFHYIAFHEPHKKVASPPELIAHYPNASPKDAEYFANIENLDKAVGRILAELDKHDLRENTFIFFSSDNGPYRPGSAGDLRGLKGSVYEGGLKVPAIISWPKQFPKPAIIKQPVWFQDLLPTVCAITSQKTPNDRPIDGLNILPLLQGKSVERSTPLFWFFYRSEPEVAMLKPPYIIMGVANDTIPRTHRLADIDMDFIKNVKLKKFELYNINKDPQQSQNDCNNRRDICKQMQKELITLLQEVSREGTYWQGLPKNTPEQSKQKTRYKQSY